MCHLISPTCWNQPWMPQIFWVRRRLLIMYFDSSCHRRVMHLDCQGRSYFLQPLLLWLNSRLWLSIILLIFRACFLQRLCYRCVLNHWFARHRLCCSFHVLWFHRVWQFALLGEHAAVDLLSVHQIFIFICLIRVLASYQVLILVCEHISLALFLEISHSWLWAAIQWFVQHRLWYQHVSSLDTLDLWELWRPCYSR